MNEIQLFKSEQFGQVRTAGTPDNPLFCLADICKAIGINNARAVKQRLDEDDVSLIDTIDSMGRNQSVTFITESGLYDVIIRSDNPNAKPFRKWVTSEVLPAIRKTGGYIPTNTQDTDAEIMAKALLVAQKTMEHQKQRLHILEGQKKMLEQENNALAPKAAYTDEVLQSSTTYTHTQMAKELNFRSVTAFLSQCATEKILYKQSGMWMLYSRYAGNGYMKMRTTPYTCSDGTVKTNSITVWTEEGRRFLHEHFNIAIQPIEISIDWGEKEI